MSWARVMLMALATRRVRLERDRRTMIVSLCLYLVFFPLPSLSFTFLASQGMRANRPLCQLKYFDWAFGDGRGGAGKFGRLA